MTGIHSRRWARASRRHRAAHPLCAMCEARGIITLGTVVDHIVPRHQAPDRTYDPTNWQTLCSSCHNSGKRSIENRGYDIKSIGQDGWPTDPLHPANRKK